MIFKLTCLFIVAVGSNLAHGYTQEEHILDACVRFSSAVGVPFNKTRAKVDKFQLPQMRGTSWTVSEGERYYVVDDRERYVKGFSDGAVERELRQAGTVQKQMMSESLLWKKSESILASLDKHSKLSRWKYVGSRAASKQGASPRATCNFSQKAFGIDSAGVGNFLSISWDSRNGRIASLTCSRGWKYDKPHVNVSREDARVLAGEIARKQLGIVSPAKSIRYQFLMPIEMYGSRLGNAFRKAKRIRAGYVVNFSGCDVFLDAETGESLGGKTTKK